MIAFKHPIDNMLQHWTLENQSKFNVFYKNAPANICKKRHAQRFAKLDILFYEIREYQCSCEQHLATRTWFLYK